MKTHELARKLLEYPDLPLKMGRTEIVWISDITSDERDIEEPIKYLVDRDWETELPFYL